MRISTSKSMTMVLTQKMVECPLRVVDKLLPQVEEFRYLVVLFTSEGRMKQKIDGQIGVVMLDISYRTRLDFKHGCSLQYRTEQKAVADVLSDCGGECPSACSGVLGEQHQEDAGTHLDKLAKKEGSVMGTELERMTFVAE